VHGQREINDVLQDYSGPTIRSITLPHAILLMSMQAAVAVSRNLISTS
jgi:hypothetical protein